jgi:uncharacterized protein (TIGR03086 family)
MRLRQPGSDTGSVAKSDVDPSSVHRVAELIELGRDREAAELGDRRHDRGGQMDVLDQLDELGPLLGGVVANITPDQLDNPTPCSDFTVRGVLGHMIEGATAFAAAFRAQEPEPPDTSDVLTGFGPALTELDASIRSDGALDRTVQAPFGAVEGETFARFVVLDGLVHGWDLARATDQPYAPPDDLVAEVEAFAREALPPLRDGVTFGDEREASTTASAIERLAAFTGRQV